MAKSLWYCGRERGGGDRERERDKAMERGRDSDGEKG